MHREDIQRELAAMKPKLEAEYHVAEIGIFGSYAREEQTEESDLDILVEFDRPIGLFDFVRLENEISDRLGIDVDLVTRESLRPRIEASVDDDVLYVSAIRVRISKTSSMRRRKSSGILRTCATRNSWRMKRRSIPYCGTSR